MKTFHTDVAVLPRRLFTLERCGRYEEAFSELGNIWDNPQSFPAVDGLPPRLAAEVVLRCGAIYGFYGHIKQITGSQEISKNLLTEARNLFFNFCDTEKVAECENYLALAYWRTGELVEAETWIEESLTHKISNFSQTRLYSHIIRCLIYIPSKKFKEIASNLRKLEDKFLCSQENCLKGDFYNHYGLALKNLGDIAGSLEKLELARYYHQKSGHQIYLGTVENNLAQLYKAERRFTQAHEAIDNATKIFKQIKDHTREGFSFDTKAAIFCEEGKFPDALKVIEKAIGILKKSENAAYLVETYLTKSKILLSLDDFSAALFSLFDAVQLARTKISEDTAKNLVSEFEKALEEKNNSKLTETFTEKETISENLELVLPSALSHYREFKGVWIKNSYLENVGLRKGSLAIVTEDKISRGDLVAITELATDLVLCGFYDAEFGIVCLEGIGDEPHLFDENEIKILGRIVGVCHSEKSRDGKMIVEPL